MSPILNNGVFAQKIVPVSYGERHQATQIYATVHPGVQVPCLARGAAQKVVEKFFQRIAPGYVEGLAYCRTVLGDVAAVYTKQGPNESRFDLELHCTLCQSEPSDLGGIVLLHCIGRYLLRPQNTSLSYFLPSTICDTAYEIVFDRLLCKRRLSPEFIDDWVYLSENSAAGNGDSSRQLWTLFCVAPAASSGKTGGEDKREVSAYLYNPTAARREAAFEGFDAFARFLIQPSNLKRVVDAASVVNVALNYVASHANPDTGPRAAQSLTDSLNDRCAAANRILAQLNPKVPKEACALETLLV